MKEFDIESTWKKSNEKATEYYEYIEPEISNKAKKKSNNILKKLKRTIIIEWILNFAALPIIATISWSTHYFYGIIIVFFIIFIISWFPYRTMLLKIEKASTKNISECLESYIEILDQFIKRVKKIVCVIVPIAFLLGIYIGINSKGDEFQNIHTIDKDKLIAIIPITLIISVISILLINKVYLPMLYGKPKTRFEEVLKQLKTKDTYDEYKEDLTNNI